MADAPAFLSAHIISELRKLDGRAKVTFPYADSTYRRVERIQKVDRGTTASPGWLLAFGSADAEYSDAKLTQQTKLGEDGTTAEVYRVWEELTGLPLVTREVYGFTGIYKETIRQRVPVPTLPDGSGGATFSASVRDENALYAESITVHLVDADGNELDGGAILTTSSIDPETGTPIYTDRFLAVRDYALPAIKASAGSRNASGGVTGYDDWKQPNTNHVGYSASSYSPARYPISARKIEIEGSEKVIVEVEYCRKPSASVEDGEYNGRWPAVFEHNDTIAISDSDPNTGPYRPPFPIGPEDINGYRLTPHRYGGAQRRITTSTIGRAENLPPKFKVLTPGVASILFRGQIPEECIHGPSQAYYERFDGTGSLLSKVLIENLPSSTPAQYDENALYVIEAEEVCWKGEMYLQRVVLASESLPLSQFPDPAVFLRRAIRHFTKAPEVPLRAQLGNKQVYVLTFAAATVTADTTTNEIALTNHGLHNGQAVTFSSSGTTPSPLIANVTYYALVVDTDHFQVSATRLGTALDLTTAGTGTVKVSGAPVSVTSTGSETVDLRLWGKSNSGEGAFGTINSLTAAPTVTATPGDSLSASHFQVLHLATLAQPLVSDALAIFSPVIPDEGSLTVNAVPADGKLLKVGYVGSDERIYQFRSALAADAVTSVTVGFGGSGYTSGYVDVTFSGGGGSGAAATATVVAGVITAIKLAAPGSSYESTPSVTITPKGSGGAGTAHLTGGGVSSISLDSGGTDYGAAPAVSFTDGGTTATGTVTVSGGAVTGVSITDIGSGYNGTSTVTLAPSTTGGTGATINVTVNGSGGVTGTSVVTGGTGWTNGDGVLLIGGKGSGAAFTATISGGAITGFTQTSAGSGYVAAPHVVITPLGSGATATAAISAANQILIKSAPRFQATAIMQAINGTALGSNVGNGTEEHADLRSAIESSDNTSVRFISTNPTYNAVDPATEWVLSLYDADGSTPDASWGTVQDFEAGGAGTPLAIIPAGIGAAFALADFASNAPILFDGAPDNDSKAVPSVPAELVFYTDWLPVPPGKELTIRYASIGKLVKVAYQLASSTDEPARSTVSVGVTHNSKTLSPAVSSSYVGKAIFIDGDSQENEVLSTTSLMRPYGGTTGTQNAQLVPLVANTLNPSGDGQIQQVVIGTPNASFIRLKISQGMKSISDRMGLLRVLAMTARMEWTLTIDD